MQEQMPQYAKAISTNLSYNIHYHEKYRSRYGRGPLGHPARRQENRRRSRQLCLSCFTVRLAELRGQRRRSRSAAYAITDNLSIGAQINYTWTASHTLRKRDYMGRGKDQLVWGGISMTFAF